MESELFYRIALTRVPGIGPMLAKSLFRHVGEASVIFRTPATALGKIRGIGKMRAWAIAGFKQFRSVEKEMAFIEKYKVRALFFTDAGYPRRLSDHADSPVLLYYMGSADLNAANVVAVIGTRTPTSYGKEVIDRVVREFTVPDLLLVSGLAYGIDALAHKAALSRQLATVGVLGHGLDRIYPPQHSSLARQMVAQGGLLTEFGIGTEPDEHHFPLRNRIIAGMSDAVVVVESGSRGGSMLTVDNALAYRKKVYAIPGRIMDSKSAGANALIQQGKARLLSDGRQLIRELEQQKEPESKSPVAPALPGMLPEGRSGVVSPEQETARQRTDLRLSRLTPEERSIMEVLQPGKRISLDDLMRNELLSRPSIPLALLRLEIQGLIRPFPGKSYGRV
ncbi:MAG: DNA-processing protein DprA [Bacteroidota bacterium]|nr:DNA-processing protein DprA [Bacteroidota bacterium]MDP4252764.1 DNA-processing protein DprA [Bacteroidota bacterium]